MKTHFDDVEELKDLKISKDDALMILQKVRDKITAKYVRAALRMAITELDNSFTNQ